MAVTQDTEDFQSCDHMVFIAPCPMYGYRW